MQKSILLYGLLLAALVLSLKYVEYHFLVRSFSLEVYLGITALFFTGIGVWIALSWKKPKETTTQFNQANRDKALNKMGISKRELEVLEQMALGLSNKEIGEKLFVSENTVKTHAANLYDKIGVKRRTQAIQKARELNIIE